MRRCGVSAASPCSRASPSCGRCVGARPIVRRCARRRVTPLPDRPTPGLPGQSWSPTPTRSTSRRTHLLTRRSTTSCRPWRCASETAEITAASPHPSMNPRPERSNRALRPSRPSRRRQTVSSSAAAMSSSPVTTRRTTPSDRHRAVCRSAAVRGFAYVQDSHSSSGGQGSPTAIVLPRTIDKRRRCPLRPRLTHRSAPGDMAARVTSVSTRTFGGRPR